MLTKNEHKRYNRHLILDQVGLEGQEKLKAAKVLVIGAGGLGCPVLQYLTAAGVGNIGIIDFDTVDLSNLQRQILFTTADIGKNKAQCAADRLKFLNPNVAFTVFTDRLTTTNALEIFNQFDLIIDGSDNFSTRYLVNDAAVLTNKPLIYGSIYTFQGQIAVFNYNNGPTYRCLFPIPPKEGTIKNCSQIGVIGVLPGIIGTQQANEAIKIILNIGDSLSGHLLIYDALKATYMKVAIRKVAEEIDKVHNMRTSFNTYNYDLFCGLKKENSKNEIDPIEFKKLINKNSVQIIDLRDEWEEPQLTGTNIERITMSALPKAIPKFSKTKQIVLFCQLGNRSNQVKTLLESTYGYKNIIQLKGGIENYDNN